MILAGCNDLNKDKEELKNGSSLLHLDLNTQGRYDECMVNLLSRPSELGDISKGITKHFYSTGAFNLIQLVVYLLAKTGPADIFLSTYSISTESLSVLKRLKDKGKITSIKFLIDNRVKSISPIQYDLLCNSFPGLYRSCALHAKMALLYNEEWSISVVGSQNATHNPKMERGIIHTDPRVWMFDYKMLSDAFNNGTD